MGVIFVWYGIAGGGYYYDDDGVRWEGELDGESGNRWHGLMLIWKEEGGEKVRKSKSKNIWRKGEVVWEEKNIYDIKVYVLTITLLKRKYIFKKIMVYTKVAY